jgi:hypothetical protein
MRRMSPPRSSVWLAVLAAGSLAIASCGDPVDSPTGLEQPERIAQSEDQSQVDGEELDARLRPNGVPYRNPGYTNATGRSGGASLTARALLNQDGTTDLEVTTGDLDGDPPPHDMTRLQVKYLTPAEEEEWTENHNRLGSGYVAESYDGLLRHGFLQAQANVRVPNASGKGARTGVVTVQERINLRPDLAVTGLSGPSEVIVNTAAAFVAGISELNGDLSATSNCVFYLNGNEVTRSVGVWVGEGDSVTCVAVIPFTAVGEHTVTVAVENVVPGDFDLSNNQKSVTVTVTERVYQLRGTASAAQRHWLYRSSDSDWYIHNEGRTTEASFYGVSRAAPVRFPAQLTMVQRSGGVLQDEASTEIGQAGDDPCATLLTTRSTVQVCRNSDGYGTFVNITRNGGYATYYTRHTHRETRRYCARYDWLGRCAAWGSDTIIYYHIHNNSYETVGWGGYTPLGYDYRFDVRIEDDFGQVFESGEVIVPLQGYSSHGYYQYWGKQGTVSFGS